MDEAIATWIKCSICSKESVLGTGDSSTRLEAKLYGNNV